ncbi:unnamed protein product [Rhizophagus irregularis]|nr:unnamed protein product [Rhizophagus irregularis]CAB4433042.1 unnamed protein product [Rhizophagus irregularis]
MSENPKETRQEDLQKKLEELVQQIQEQDQSAAASQKSMNINSRSGYKSVSLHPVQQNENVTQYFIAEKPQISNHY